MLSAREPGWPREGYLMHLQARVHLGHIHGVPPGRPLRGSSHPRAIKMLPKKEEGSNMTISAKNKTKKHGQTLKERQRRKRSWSSHRDI